MLRALLWEDDCAASAEIDAVGNELFNAAGCLIAFCVSDQEGSWRAPVKCV